MSAASKDESDDDEATPVYDMGTVKSIITQPDDAGEEATSAVISTEDEEDVKPFLKYKHRGKKVGFKQPKLQLNRFAEHLAKVENAILKKRNNRPQIQQQRQQQEESLSTPSELTVAPSDFEHVFHAQNQTINSNIKKQQWTIKDQQKREQDYIFKLFQSKVTKDPIIPIYITDNPNQPKVINLSLSRLNQLSQLYLKEVAGKGIKAVTKTIPFIKAFQKRESSPANSQMKQSKIKMMVRSFQKPKSETPKGSSQLRSKQSQSKSVGGKK